MELQLKLIKKIAPDLTQELIKRYRILKTVSLLQPCGRRTVVLSLGMTERTVRSEIELFSMQKLVQVSKSGMTVTEEGIAVLEGLGSIFSNLTGLFVLEEKLAKILGVKKVCIAQGNAEVSDHSHKEMGRLAMRYMLEKSTEQSYIAITGGASMKEVVSAVPEMSKGTAKMIVPARGSIGRKMELQADTLAVELASKLQGEYRLLHLPDNLSETALEEMKKQPEIAETVLEMAKTDILLLGIGNGLEMAEKRRLDKNVKKYLKDSGVVAEACGYYFDELGKVVYKTSSIAINFNEIPRIKEVILVAGGKTKAASILAVSHSIPNGVFVTDESAALEIIQLVNRRSKSE